LGKHTIDEGAMDEKSGIKNNKRSLISKKTYLYFKKSSLAVGIKKLNLPSLKLTLQLSTEGYSCPLLLRVVVLRKGSL
jgi:hypothetical protein